MSSSKTIGNSFEILFERLCRLSGIACTRIPDGCKQFGKGKIIPVRSPWDYVLTHNSKTALIDTKTTNEKAFCYSSLTTHQVQSLEYHEAHGAIAGYLVWTRANNQMFFIPARVLLKTLVTAKTGSFGFEDKDVVSLGVLGKPSLELKRIFV